MLTLILAAALSLLALAAIAVKHVPAGQVFSLYRHGKPVRLLQPGTHVVLPLLDRVGHRIDLGGRVLRGPPHPSATRPKLRFPGASGVPGSPPAGARLQW